MHDRNDGGHDRGAPRHGQGDDQRRDERRDGDGRGQRGGGQDTRFLQLEMSQVLYSEAEGITRQAFRELLLDAAKQRWRERFGDQIVGLAQLAVDELMADVLASLDIESRIQDRSERGKQAKDRLRDIFGTQRPAAADDQGNDER